MNKTLGAIALALALSSFASADTLLFTDNATASSANAAPAGSTGLGPNGAFGGIGGPVSFTMPTAGTLALTVTDCCVVGDVYQAFVDGTSLGFTSPEPLNGTTPSTGTFDILLAAGMHTYDINDRILSYMGFASPFGGGTVTANFSPAGLTISGVETAASTTPEPGTLGLLGLVLAGGAAFLRRKKA